MTTRKSKSVQHLQSININDEYGTPKDLFYEACIKFDLKLKMDYAASKTNHVLDYYLTQEENSLRFLWKWNGFGNFPYSKQKQFMKYAYESHLKYNIDLLILAYAKTDTKWWHDFVENKAEVHFIKGRIKFLDSTGVQTKNSSPYPSCWIIYRRKD